MTRYNFFLVLFNILLNLQIRIVNYYFTSLKSVMQSLYALPIYNHALKYSKQSKKWTLEFAWIIDDYYFWLSQHFFIFHICMWHRLNADNVVNRSKILWNCKITNKNHSSCFFTVYERLVLLFACLKIWFFRIQRLQSSRQTHYITQREVFTNLSWTHKNRFCNKWTFKDSLTKSLLGPASVPTPTPASFLIEFYLHNNFCM